MGFYLKKQKPYEYSDEKLKSNSEILLIITQSPGRLAYKRGWKQWACLHCFSLKVLSFLITPRWVIHKGEDNVQNTVLCIEYPNQKKMDHRRGEYVCWTSLLLVISLKHHWFCEDRILRVIMRGVCNYAKSLLSIQVQQTSWNVHLCLAKWLGV